MTTKPGWNKRKGERGCKYDRTEQSATFYGIQERCCSFSRLVGRVVSRFVRPEREFEVRGDPVPDETVERVSSLV